MATNVPPPGAPRPSRNNLVPPPNYIPNVQRTPDSLADNLQNLNLNRPPSMPNSAPRPGPFGQPPPFASSPPSQGIPGAPPPFARPGVPPGALGRPVVPPSGPPLGTFPSGGAPVRPAGPPVAQPSPFASRPPPGTLPPLIGGYVPPGSGPFPSGISQSSGFLSGPVAPPPVEPGAQPTPISSPLATGQVLQPPRVPGGLMSNGPPSFASVAVPGAPRFPPAGNALQRPLGPSLTTVSSAPPRAPSMGTGLGGSPPGVPMQPTSPFSPAAQGTLLPTGPPFGSPTWPMQPGQV